MRGVNLALSHPLNQGEGGVPFLTEFSNKEKKVSLDSIKNRIPDYAKDLRLNLSTVLSPEGAPGLNEEQIHAVALASAIAARNTVFSEQIEAYVKDRLSETVLQAAKAAAAIMAMNNVYYRSMHLLSDKEYGSMPARLRMNIIGNPGVEKRDFELYSLAVSAVNGCGLCLDAHEKVVIKAGLGKQAVHSAIRIAAVMHAVAVTLEQEQQALQKAA